jgi:hypothetical protein
VFAPLFPLAVTETAHHEVRAASFRLEYSAPPGCPSREQFVGAIMKRAPGASERPLAPSAGAQIAGDDASMLVIATLAEHQGTTSGELTFRVRKLTVTREIPPAPCAEVADSMALMIAVALEQAADESRGDSSKTVPSGTTEDAPSGSAAQTAPPKPNDSKSAEARAKAKPAPSEGEAREGTLVPLPSPGDRGNFRMGLSVAGGAEAGPASGLLPAFSAGVDGWWARQGWLSPSARVRLLYGERSVRTAIGGADFRLLTARMNLCPLRYPGPWLSLRFCSNLDIGQLRAQGVDVAHGRTETMLWLGVGGSVRAEYALATVFSLEAGVDLNFMANRDRFSFQPGDQLVHQVPGTALGGFFGAVARLP